MNKNNINSINGLFVHPSPKAILLKIILYSLLLSPNSYIYSDIKNPNIGLLEFFISIKNSVLSKIRSHPYISTTAIIGGSFGLGFLGYKCKSLKKNAKKVKSQSILENDNDEDTSKKQQVKDAIKKLKNELGIDKDKDIIKVINDAFDNQSDDNLQSDDNSFFYKLGQFFFGAFAMFISLSAKPATRSIVGKDRNGKYHRIFVSSRDLMYSE